MPRSVAKLLRMFLMYAPMTLARAFFGAGVDSFRQRRFVITEGSDVVCSYHCAFVWPTWRRFLKAFGRRLGLAESDFRRRAESVADNNETLPALPVVASVLLAGERALADPAVQDFLRQQVADGLLRVMSSNDAGDVQPGMTNLLAGVEADAEGQARLLDLRRHGIVCDWLTGRGTLERADMPLREACWRQATPTVCGVLDYEPISILQVSTLRKNIASLARPLRVLTYRWHVPHQYELFKLGAEFTLVADLGESSCRWWDLGQRPLPANARFARWGEIDPRAFDLAILHFDENVLRATADARCVGACWGATFRFLRQNLEIPCVAVCHGTPPGESLALRQELVDFLGDIPVVVNSHQAHAEWGFAQARVIWQGFDPAEFPCRAERGSRLPSILTLPSEAYAERPGYRGADLLGAVAAKLTVPMARLNVPEPNLLLSGNAYAEARFARYVAALHEFDIYFNPTLRSPMPRSRGEAMLCGLATVNADSHDVDRFIVNGTNGFYAATADELAEYLRFLLDNPAHAWRIGCAGRETAMRLFHIDRYLDDWRNLIRTLLGSDAI